MGKLDGKTIIITGGAKGQGAAEVKLATALGAQVVVTDILEEEGRKIAEETGNVYLNLDVTSPEQWSDVAEFTVSEYGRIDGLINNIGIAGPTSPLEKIKSDDWEKTIHVNVNSHFYFTKYAIPMIKKSKNGSIINISSTAGIDGFPNRSPYAASKWALVGITKTLAMELGKFNIRVNAICPGSVKGARMMRVIKAKAKMLKRSVRSIEKDFVSMSSLKQWVYEEDIAKMCSFLISQDSLRVSGQVISIDGNTERMD